MSEYGIGISAPGRVGLRIRLSTSYLAESRGIALEREVCKKTCKIRNTTCKVQNPSTRPQCGGCVGLRKWRFPSFFHFQPSLIFIPFPVVHICKSLRSRCRGLIKLQAPFWVTLWNQYWPCSNIQQGNLVSRFLKSMLELDEFLDQDLSNCGEVLDSR